MSDYLSSLVTRTLGLAPVVQPRPASLFEPVAPAGPVSEPAFEVSENVAPQKNAPPPARTEHQPFDVPAKTKQPVVENFPVGKAPLPSALSTQVTPAATFSEGIWDRDSKREVRDPELSPRSRSAGTDSTTSASEKPFQPAPFLIKPDVRIVSSATDPEPVQPSLTTPPLRPVLSNTTRPDALGRSRELIAQPTEPAEAPETVVVTIGRVDVRAIFTPPQPTPRANRPQSQALSLDEYLKQRSEGRR